MPNWKKVITSGSNAILNHLTASGAISSSGIITANSFAGTIGTATQGTIDHDSLANFVANEHIDHSAVSVTAGTGLTGGGTIAANRTLNVIGGTGITANANDIAITAGGVDTTQLAADAVTAAKLASNAVVNASVASSAAIAFTKLASLPNRNFLVGNSDGIATAVAMGGDIALGNDGETTIQADSVTYDMMQDTSTANRLLGAASAGTIGEVQVVVGMMAANSVDSAQYVDASIDLAHMSANSVDSDQYVDGSIDTAHIGNDQVTSAKLAHSIAIVTTITSPTSTIGLRDLDWAGNLEEGNVTVAQGDVIYHATTTATTRGDIYAMNTSGVVVPADADAVATASTILCVALGTNASLGLLLRGTVVLRTSPGAQAGLPIYLSTTAGGAQAAAPSGTGDVVRVVGYQLTPNGEGDQVNVCYFNPDNTWVELT
tara:strand:- start:2413 stop:3708 length:1296 start_codon:yes stop_codon:yes gene_type:complete